jgi:hypothetical protein
MSANTSARVYGPAVAKAMMVICQATSESSSRPPAWRTAARAGINPGTSSTAI